MIPARQLDKIQTFLEKILSDLEPAQDAYFAQHGRYFQFLPTHANRVPGERVPERLDARPSDQPHSIRGVLGNKWDALSFVANVRCDVYEAPEGRGWMIVSEVESEEDAELHVRVDAKGPIADKMSRDWAKVEPLEVV